MNNPVNKVAASGLISLDLERLFPLPKVQPLDLSLFLENGLVLREKPFREELKNSLLSPENGEWIALFCSNDAIIPRWAWMLAASTSIQQGFNVHFGNPSETYEYAFLNELKKTLLSTEYNQARVVVKGCSTSTVPDSAYIEVVSSLQPRVKSLMFGEPCSTVPLFKSKP
jgi:hypothetical protein